MNLKFNNKFYYLVNKFGRIHFRGVHAKILTV